jgi:flagellar hook assembly protein FlgD
VTCTATTAVSPDAGARLAFERPAPNPSGSIARFQFSLSRSGTARLELFGADGARVRTLVSGALGPGVHQAVWDGRDDGGRRLAPGLYFARLTAEERTLTRLVSRVN